MEVKSIQEVLVNTQFVQQKPTLVSVIAWMTLVSGIVNLFWGFALSGTALVTIIGVICIPLAILPTVLGVFEIIYAAKLFSNPPQAVKPSTNIAVLEVASILALNLFSMVVGILALVFYNDTVVKDYFARLNGTLSGAEVPPEPVTPPAPASLPEPTPVTDTHQEAPVIEEPAPAPSIQESPAPAQSTPAEEPKKTPAKPKKRTPRKVAKK